MAGTPAAVPRLLKQVWEPAKAKAAEERDALAEMARSLRRDARDRAVGLALLRREGAPARYDFDDARAEALLLARPHARRGVRHARSACSASASSSAPTSAATTPTCAPSRCAARDAQARGPLPQRQLRAADQARRRVDERLPLAVARARRDAADHRQQQQLRQGAGGRAHAAVRRRRAHAVPRVRARAARAALAGDLRAPVGHAGAARLRRAAVADLRALGLRARGAGAPRAAPRDGRADPRGAGRAAGARRGASTRASRPWSTPPARWWTWRCTRARIRTAWTSTRSRRRSSRASACRARS